MTKQVGYQWTVIHGVSDVDPREWDALVDPDDPFLEHGFLAALEASGSVGESAGWVPRFVICRRGKELVGAVPLYLKDHSYGEFIFDWGWAGAAERAGLRYYPKLVAAVPFTPATGRRVLVRPDQSHEDVWPCLLQGIDQVAEHTGASSVHLLFCQESESTALREHGFHPRLSLQFHWHNRSPDRYRDFEDFLSDFRSQNRKQVRKERSRARDHGFRLATLNGSELSRRDWDALEGLYQRNADHHGSIPYLTKAFFDRLRETFAHRVVATLAYDGTDVVAGTLNFQRGGHLYGRYWGSHIDADMLHFELCYYALIERAIAHGHTLFEAGAQGEHKLKRGLTPALTHSAHRIFHPGLNRAVAEFVTGEANVVRQRAAMYTAHAPFRS